MARLNILLVTGQARCSFGFFNWEGRRPSLGFDKTLNRA